MTWEVRAVTNTGTLVAVIDGVNVGSERRAINGDEYVDCTIGTLESDATFFDLFSHEIQIWDQFTDEAVTVDGEPLTVDGGEPVLVTGEDIRFWGRPARIDVSRESKTDELAIRIDSLFSYFLDEVVGGERPNHIVSPHEDAALVGALPNSWQATSQVEQHAVVDNNWEFSDAKKAIQVNNSVTGADAYIWQRFTVPPELDGVPFAAMATCYISDNEAGSPAWGGPAYNERGLVILRLDGTTTDVLSKPQVAKITAETPRNALVRLQTPEVTAHAGEIIDVRLYAPDAWTAWRYAVLRDGRWVGVDRKDKSVAVQTLVEHAQDTTLGKQAHNIGTDLVTIGESITRRWPWWRRDNIGEQIRDLADTFEFDIAITPTTRNVRVRSQVGTDRTGEAPLAKAAFVGWALGAETAGSASRVIRQGDGQGVARDEWWTDDPLALNGKVKELLQFAGPGETLAQLRDNAEVELVRSGNVDRIPRARLVGARAKTARPGDTFAVTLNHGAAVYNGNARAMAVDFDYVTKVATLHLEPV